MFLGQSHFKKPPSHIYIYNYITVYLVLALSRLFLVYPRNVANLLIILALNTRATHCANYLPKIRWFLQHDDKQVIPINCCFLVGEHMLNIYISLQIMALACLEVAVAWMQTSGLPRTMTSWPGIREAQVADLIDKPNGSADCKQGTRIMWSWNGMSQNLINRALKGLPSGCLAVCELDTIIKSQFLIGK